MAKWWHIKNQGNKTAEVRIYGVIANEKYYESDVTPTDFQNELDALGDIELLNVYINSPGGSVFAGFAIYNILKRHKAAVACHVDGMAASIASVILQAGDERVMAINGMVMIHQPMILAMGNATELRKWADDLDKITEPIIASYTDRSTLEHDKILDMMTAETWMTAEEAVELGFADKVNSNSKADASAEDKNVTINGITFDLSNFRNFDASRLVTANNRNPEPNPVPAPAGTRPIARVVDPANTQEPGQRVDYKQYEDALAKTDAILKS